jgi:predicted nucleic acid-binding protein
VTERRKIRLFLDSNVITGGMVSTWGLDKAILSVCAAKICRLVLAEAVRDEVDFNLLQHAEMLPRTRAEQLLSDYQWLMTLCEPEMIPYPDQIAVRTSRWLIRHEADVPVLLSAIHCKPDWLLTNTKHFDQTVANRTGLRIATPAEFFRALSALLA